MSKEGERQREVARGYPHAVYYTDGTHSKTKNKWLTLKKASYPGKRWVALRFGNTNREHTDFIPLTKEQCLELATALTYVALIWEEGDGDGN